MGGDGRRRAETTKNDGDSTVQDPPDALCLANDHLGILWTHTPHPTFPVLESLVI